MDEKVLVYETFLNEKLRQRLKNALDQRDKIFSKINEYLQLKTKIETLKEDAADQGQLKTKVDLGCNFYVQAVVPDASKIFVSVGLGLFVELTYDEAIRFIDKKTALLTEQTETLTKSASESRAHIKLVLEGLREIQHISSETEEPLRHI